MIAIITAINSEYKAVLTNLKINSFDKIVINANTFKIASNNNYIVILTGVGIEKAKQGITYLLDNFKIDKILNIGIAGALSPNLIPGNIIIINEIVSKELKIHCDLDYIAEIKNKLIRPYISGNLFTSENAIANEGLKNGYFVKYNCLSVDMEAIALISICRKYGNVKFAAIKVISDKADNNLNLILKNDKICIFRITCLIFKNPIRAYRILKSLLDGYSIALNEIKGVIKNIL